MALRQREDELVGIEGSHPGLASYPTPAADAIIVGAGPAGSVSAMLLARAGLRVLLLDRAAFPRPKPCGDCLSAGATSLLRRLGLLDRVLAAGPAVLRGWRLVSPAGHSCDGSFDRSRALSMERGILDDILFRAALEEGARRLRARVFDLIRDPATGRVTSVLARVPGGATVRLGAPLIVGADGLRSIVARRIDAIRRGPRLRKVSLTFHATAPPGTPGGMRDAMRGRMHVLDGGCIGFAPVGRRRYNLTLVVERDRAGRLGELGPHRFLRHWLRQAPDLAERVAALDLDDEVLASGPFDQPTRTAVGDGVALVGDAAGYYDPFTGQGTHHAMAGAEMLAGTLGPALRLRSPAALDAALREYDARLRRHSASARRLQYVIEWALRSPERADRVVGRLAGAPRVVDRLVDVTGDLRPPRSLLSPALLSSFIAASRCTETA